MRLEFAHNLSAEEARRVAHKVAADYAERFARYSPQVDWKEPDHAEISITAKGVTLEGSFTSQPGTLVFEAKVPFLLRPFSGMAKDVIEKQVELWVGRAQRGEL